jgi:hypothetical protein
VTLLGHFGDILVDLVLELVYINGKFDVDAITVMASKCTSKVTEMTPEFPENVKMTELPIYL